jgi:hypothetical protein
MKTSTLYFALLLLVGHAQAQSTFQRELAQLVDQRDKALAAAAAPIQARFKQQAEQLLQRAKQNNDAAAVAELQALLSGNQEPGVVRDLKRQLSGTKWKLLPNVAPRGGLTGSLSFSDKTVEPGGYQYEAAHSSVTVIFNRGGREVLELMPDGKHLRFPKGPAAYELATP